MDGPTLLMMCHLHTLQTASDCKSTAWLNVLGLLGQVTIQWVIFNHSPLPPLASGMKTPPVSPFRLPADPLEWSDWADQGRTSHFSHTNPIAHSNWHPFPRPVIQIRCCHHLILLPIRHTIAYQPILLPINWYYHPTVDPLSTIQISYFCLCHRQPNSLDILCLSLIIILYIIFLYTLICFPCLIYIYFMRYKSD